MKFGTNPLQPDSDDDGIDDAKEINELKTNPLLADSDNDGLTDYEESLFNSDPLSQDTDNNGISDGEDEHSVIIFTPEKEIVFELLVNKEQYKNLYINKELNNNELGQISDAYECKRSI